MAKWNTGEKNGFWKGGRTITEHGYVLIRVDLDHHLADMRGYAYEHRIVVEQKIGRCLRKGEQVHHINGNKTDNRPENLEVCASAGHHLLHHRTTGYNRRHPDQENPIIQCACGCGQSFSFYDEFDRPRNYISGHNPMPSPTIDLILCALEDGPKDLHYLAELHGNLHAVKNTCSRLVKQGRIVRLNRGIYGRANQD